MSMEHFYLTVMSLLEAPGGKALMRALLFRAILRAMGAIIVCYYHMIL